MPSSHTKLEKGVHLGNLYTSTNAGPNVSQYKPKNSGTLVRTGRRNIWFHVPEAAQSSSPAQKKTSGQCQQRSRRTLRGKCTKTPAHGSSQPIDVQTLGHIFGDTYVSHGAVAMQGDIHHTTKPKIVIYAGREKRSSLDVLVASLIGTTAGGAITTYTTAKSSCRTPDQKDNKDEDDGAKPWTSNIDDLHSERLILASTGPGSSSLFSPHDATSYLGTEVVPQLNMAEVKPPLLHRQCNMAYKTPRTTSLRQSVIVLKVGNAQNARYRFFTQQLRMRSNVIVTDDFEEVLSVLPSQNSPKALVIYDTPIPKATMSQSVVTHEAIQRIAEFVSSGGTIVFGPECNIMTRQPSIADLLEDVWPLQLRPSSQSCRTQFWVSPRLARCVAGALSHYFKRVARQLLDRSCASDSVYATESSAGASLPYGIWGPRYRSASERLLVFVEHGKGKLGVLGKLGSKQDTYRMISRMLSLGD
ncbi:hypothetical protein LTR64_008807 [Lithohypha guttulata]|uniref:uncharacterized protein n=1 Tax=Lithohypha guttulata TaxID=1690604 RepID=UPI002DDF4DD2|nr:hypothetical protein LTR51_008824 [Lithohypha guttulata]